LLCVRGYVRQALAALDGAASDPLHVVSICAGDGRDVLSVAGELDLRRSISITLIELDPELAERARQSAADLQADVHVLQADAGDRATYAGLSRADVVLACGVFGNISVADAQTTIRFLPRLLNPDGFVIWTRGRPEHGEDPSEQIRVLFASAGFRELGFTAPDDARFRVGIVRLQQAADVDPEAPERLFSFTR
jgi:hypothetical protein